MKRMLINATQREELRVALVDGQRLFDLDIEATGKEQKKSNIYKGRIIRIEPSLEAAFVDYGADRHGFLPLKEVARSYFKEGARTSGKIAIREVLEEGQELVVQVEKEERGNKGAALTTFISLAGRYLVAMPNNPRAGGVSRQIEGEAREEAKEALASLNVPTNFGLILRTAGIDQSPEELQWDFDYLLQLWAAVEEAAKSRPAPFLIYQDQNVIIRAIRDYLRNDIAEILVDDRKLFDTACEFMKQVMPHNLGKIKHYTDSVPLFTRYQIEMQIENAFSREVRLPSGGALVIEPTEALITIDINSARATHGSDIEETALNTNLEAADEIATQLRLRDLGGLIVVDFIDMMSSKNQRAVENRMRDAVKMDRARVQIGRISRFGLLEMSRQRLRPSLSEFSHEICPRCDGVGTIRSVKSTALSVLRVIEEEAMKDSTAKVAAQVPVDVATFLLNEKRQDVTRIEERQEIGILLIPNQNLETPHFQITRIRDQDLAKRELGESYEMVNEVETKPVQDYTKLTSTPSREQPAIKEIVRATPKPPTPETERPAPEPQQAPGLIRRIFSGLFGGGPALAPAPTPAVAPAPAASTDTEQRRRRPQPTGERQSAPDRERSAEGGARGGEEKRGRRRGGRGRGEAREGNRGEAREGNRGEAREGNRGEAREGNRGEAREGSRGEAREGNRGEARRGEAREGSRGEAREGNRGEAREGNRGEAREGGRGEAREGNRGEAREGHRGEAREGNRGEGREGNRGEGRRERGPRGDGQRGERQPRQEPARDEAAVAPEETRSTESPVPVAESSAPAPGAEPVATRVVSEAPGEFRIERVAPPAPEPVAAPPQERPLPAPEPSPGPALQHDAAPPPAAPPPQEPQAPRAAPQVEAPARPEPAAAPEPARHTAEGSDGN
ncbi:MAG: Rne/Rng family ribonuclease [Gammaproteobacteria bacterium]|nr:Rne/Rng family ribonuclease [Gammaproteobacteria bacterium]